MKTGQKDARRGAHGHYSHNEVTRRAVGYIRVSIDMQAAEGLSLDAQQAAIENYCAAQGIKLVQVVAIRESIRLDSSLGRALVSILLVFAQMEREATGERTREAVCHIQTLGYYVGKVPYGKRAVPAPENPRYRVLINDPEEQAVLARLKAWGETGVGISEMAARLNAEGVSPPQSPRWTKSLLYNLRLRMGWISQRSHNESSHSDAEVRERIVELRGRGHTYLQIAAILNEQGWLPLKGRRFTVRSVGHVLRNTDETKLLSPRRFLENVLERMELAHAQEHPGEPFVRPGYPRLARLLTESGYVTPKGHGQWWPAQVQQLLAGRFEQYYPSRENRP